LAFAGTKNVTNQISELKAEDLGENKVVSFVYFEHVKILIQKKKNNNKKNVFR
jgi:hypothetical protein